MSDVSSQTSGSIDREGGRLLVESPPGMPAPTWAVIAQRLLMFARGSEIGATTIAVPVDQAHLLHEVLVEPWPARLWPWHWSTTARATTDASIDLAAALSSLLIGDQAPSVPHEQIENDLHAAGFSRRLLPAQMTAVSRLTAVGHGANFSVPGSGKTTMTLALFALLRRAGVVDRMLVVAPASAYEAWTEETKDCFNEPRRPRIEVAPTSPRRSSDVVVYNYERVAMGATRAAVDGWSHGHRLMVVFDEAHRAKKGEDGLHGIGARDVASLATARYALTGTPMPNGRADLAAVLDLVWPGHGDRLADPACLNADRTWVRITKDDLDLADAVIEVERVRLDETHRAIYDAFTSDLSHRTSLIQAFPAIASTSTTRLLATATNPALLLGGSGDATLDWRDSPDLPDTVMAALSGLSSMVRPTKILRVAHHAAEHRARGDKLLVWTNFIGNVHELARVLEPFAPAVVTGEVPVSDPGAPTDRVRELRRFREDPDCFVLIATPQTLGEGVSLHKVCQSQIHLDRSYNAGLFLQAIDRTHRVGMPEGTTAQVRVLVAEDTIDEDVDRRLRLKVDRMNQVLNDPALRRLALPDEAAPAVRPMSESDITGLVGHLRRETTDTTALEDAGN
ncbi:DEAD/DEAH box helicase [Nocardioides sp.]|uniref:SNF2-related protein n=1 Tax=Nocardioides sp. TaxID=35761 RepID=UPI002715A21C|nr:DEAD/DEAH box helicase [Nocardioides sp.]MDO9455225.1 DEAD/DEAH box helicase [Nocardioides sp.]